MLLLRRLLLVRVVGCGERVRSFERVVMLVVNEEETSSAVCIAAEAICLISSSSVSVLGAVDVRLRDVARRVEGGGGESTVVFEEELVGVGVRGVRRDVVEGGLVGSAGGWKACGWWRVETIVAVRWAWLRPLLDCWRRWWPSAASSFFRRAGARAKYWGRRNRV